MSILKKFKRLLRICLAILYLFYCRIKNIGKPKAIAQVVESFNSGGLEQVAANIYKAFNELSPNDNSYIICLSNNLGPMCQQLSSPKHLRIIYYDLAEMIRFCAKNNIRALVYHFTTYHLPFLKLIGFRNYYIVHNTYIWYTQGEWEKLKFKLKFSNGIIAVSEWCKDYFVKKTGINNVRVILNGINIENLNDGEKSSINREKLNIKEDEIVCLTLGSYTDGKHQLALIGIAEEVIKQNDKIKFVTAGPILDKKMFKEFKTKVKESTACNNIIILDYISQNEIGKFIEEMCDIYLQPSIHEAGVPLTVMEALLKGKLVIMTDFMIEKTFPNSKRIFGINPPYDNILDITPEIAHKLSKTTSDRSTKLYANQICTLAKELNLRRDDFNLDDYKFLDSKRMGREYVDYINLK